MSDKKDLHLDQRLQDFLTSFSKEHDLKNLKDASDSQFQDLVKMAADKWHLDSVLLREISTEEILYLLEHCLFLQIIERGDTVETLEEVKITEAKSGWSIFDYGDAMCSSPGRYIFGGGYFRIRSDDEDDDEDEGGSGVVNPGKGTIFKQAFDTAFDMIKLANEHGWDGVTIIDGHPLMMRAAWISASAVEGLVIAGFRPTAHDQKVRDLFRMSDNDMQILLRELKEPGKKEEKKGTSTVSKSKSSNDKKDHGEKDHDKKDHGKKNTDTKPSAD